LPVARAARAVSMALLSTAAPREEAEEEAEAKREEAEEEAHLGHRSR
jgi:hypothetical protein